jgi:hypothetical protein
MKLTLSLDAKLMKQIRKIAADRNTTVSGLIRDHLEQLAASSGKSGSRRAELHALERTFERFQISVGERNWKREDLYTRS